MTDLFITGMEFLSGLGLAQVLLWVLTFAVVFGVLTHLKVFKRAPSTLISIVAGFFVLMAVPASVIAIIATLSTGLIVLAIGIIVLMSLLYISQTHGYWYKHGTLVALALVVITALIFAGSGGLALIGISTLPAIGTGTWLLFIVGLAVLWMLSEAGEKPEAKEEKK